MAHKAPVIRPKGERYPGSGRKKGQPNKITVEVRTLVSELVNDPNYQHKLRADFRRRKVHPTIEGLIWNYHLGKPTQPVAMSGSMALDVTGRLEEEKRIFAQLDVRDLEVLAAESQALVDRALALTRASRAPVIDVTPQPVVVEVKAPDVEAETLGKEAGSDKESYVNPNPDSADSDNPQ